MPQQPQGPGLADTVLAIRRELKRARDDGGDDKLRFRLGPVELELELEVSGQSGVEGGLNVWVVSIGGRRGQSASARHTLRMTLHPEDEHGSGAVIHGMVPDRPVG